MIVLLCVSAPRLSPSSIIQSAARSFTEPPGLNHSAFAYTSSPGTSFSNSLTRRSGVFPISWMIPAATVLCTPTRIGTRSGEKVGSGDADDDVDRAQRVADQRAPVDRPALRRQDVQ